ncbi:VOC family protein [Actinophytocola sp.]|uniref:VOC family protein n=1 Tax=Actinophytocola sp. TaxID=1872138 RepID=UPI002D7FA4B0|nr:VOC family protein [Actinophytocola sp.]HET9139795.1 VOC family protein [Actinophytocola sp.]
MTVTAALDLAIFDAADIDKVGSFYAELTGWDVVRQDSDRFGVRAPDGQEVEFQRAPDHVAPRWPGQAYPQQFHLDLRTEDPGAQAERAVGLGATRLADGPNWITLADPAGHPFDLCQFDGVGARMQLFAVTIDAADPSALGRFYADLTGMEQSYDGPEGAFVTDGRRNLLFQRINDEYNPPRWPDPAYPQQAHLDLRVRDLDAGTARAVELGATRLDAGDDGFRVFTDPAGHPFCLVR